MGDGTWALEVRVQSPNHWTDREFPGLCFYFVHIVSSVLHFDCFQFLLNVQETLSECFESS